VGIGIAGEEENRPGNVPAGKLRPPIVRRHPRDYAASFVPEILAGILPVRCPGGGEPVSYDGGYVPRRSQTCAVDDTLTGGETKS
jgi:hypothetical protein